MPVLKTTFVDNYFGEYEYDKGNFNKACGYFKKTAVQEPNDYKSCQKIARAYYKLSYVYYGLGKQNLSLEANNKALKYSTKINDLEGLGAVYSNYTNIYRAIKDQRKAYLNINKAVQFFVVFFGFRIWFQVQLFCLASICFPYYRSPSKSRAQNPMRF